MSVTILSNNNKTVGSELSLRCNVIKAKGITSSLKFVWMKNGTPIEDDRISGINNSTLQFSYLSENDEGVYTCSVIILNTSVSDELPLDEFQSE